MKGSVFFWMTALAVLLGALVVWSFEPGARWQPIESAVPAVASETVSVEPAPELAMPADEDATERVETESFAPELQDAEAPNVPANRDVRVLVVAHDTGNPVAGAAIRYARATAIRKHRTFVGDPRADLEDVLAVIGDSATSGTDGMATIDLGRATGSVVARAGSSFGFASVLRTGDDPVRIVLFEDRTLRVCTVNGDGNPVAGVPIDIDVRTTNREISFESGTTSGPNAEFAVRHIAAVFAKTYVDGDLVARIAIPSARRIESVVDPKAWPIAPILLEVPLTGSLALELVNDSGARISHDLSVSLRPIVETIPDMQALGQARTMSKDGLARFDHVPIGLEFIASVTVSGRSQREERVAGPSHPGEEVHARIECGPEPSRVLARLVDSNGTPLVHRKIKLSSSHWTANGGGGGSGTFMTDARGRFDCIVRGGYAPGGRRSWRLSCEFDSGTPLSAELDLSRELAPGDTDLGDLQMDGLPWIASGIVVDERGDPIDGVDVAVELAAAGGWVELTKLATRSDQQGRFDLRGSTGHARLRVRAAGAGADAVEIELGAIGVRIVVQKR